MATESNANTVADVPSSSIASLRSISSTALVQQESTNICELLDACRIDGFFYLDMSGIDQRIDTLIEGICTLGREVFALPMEKLQQYDVDKLSPDDKLNGYKPLGRNRGGLANGKDGFESYNVSIKPTNV